MNENANNNSYLDGNPLNGNNNSLNNNCYGNQPLSYYPYMPCYPVCPRCYTQYNNCTENCLNPENNQANNFDGEKITNNMQSNYINEQNDKYLENADANNNISNNNITGYLEDFNSTNTLISSTLIASKEINKNLNTEKEISLSPISSYNNLNNIDSAKSLTNYNSAIIENKENIINGNQKNVQENNTISTNKSNKNNFNQIENNKAIKELGGIKLVPQNIKQRKIKYLPLKNDTL